jgi:hypothetical protein
MHPNIDAGRRPVEQVDVHHQPRAASSLRAFQLLAALGGAALFALGLLAVFEVDFGAGWLRTTAEVGGFGFSAVAAVAALVLGGATLAAALADQDRGSTAFLGMATLVVGIAGLVVQDSAVEGVQVDGRAATLFIALGAAIFVVSLVPWWSTRRTTTYVER